MEDSEIEKFVSQKITHSIEKAARDCVRELNERGSHFVADPDAIFGWVDKNTNQILEVVSTLGISVAQDTDKVSKHDPVIDRYIHVAQSEGDKIASVLNQLEGDIANGGFLQLYDNKGLAFIHEALQYLIRIGAKEAASIVEDAMELFSTNKSILAEYEDLLSQLDSCDSRFNELKESIPHLYFKYLEHDST